MLPVMLAGDQEHFAPLHHDTGTSYFGYGLPIYWLGFPGGRMARHDMMRKGVEKSPEHALGSMSVCLHHG